MKQFKQFNCTYDNLLSDVFRLSDVDECAESREVCMEGRCKNTVGSFICDCENGFAVQRGRCTGMSSLSTRCLMRGHPFEQSGSYLALEK